MLFRSWTVIGDLRIKLGPVDVGNASGVPGPPEPLPPGGLHVDRKSVWVGTGSNPVRLGQIQPPGKRFMNAVDWARGARLDPAVRAT